MIAAPREHPGSLYAILDVDAMARIAGEVSPELLAACATAAVSAGVTTVQLRAKSASPQQTLAYAAAIMGVPAFHAENGQSAGVRGFRGNLILNDRPDLALLADCSGCHLGQDDISIAAAREMLPLPCVLGLSTHNRQQVEAADAVEADYIALGPVFATASKHNPDPVLGLREFARLRGLTPKPLVAIGGITVQNARSVMDAGADSVALISGMLLGAERAADLPGAVARNCDRLLSALGGSARR